MHLFLLCIYWKLYDLIRRCEWRQISCLWPQSSRRLQNPPASLYQPIQNTNLHKSQGDFSVLPWQYNNFPSIRGDNASHFGSTAWRTQSWAGKPAEGTLCLISPRTEHVVILHLTLMFFKWREMTQNRKWEMLSKRSNSAQNLSRLPACAAGLDPVLASLCDLR